jgi:hypothetical protein
MLFEDSLDGSKLFGRPVPYLAAQLPSPLKRVDEGLPGCRLRHFGRMTPHKRHMKTTKTITSMNMMVNVLLELEARRSRFWRATGGISGVLEQPEDGRRALPKISPAKLAS